MNRNRGRGRGGGFQPRMNSGVGLLGAAPSTSNHGQRDQMSLGMKQMGSGMSDSGWNAGGNRMATGVSDSGWNAGGNRMGTGVSDSGWNAGGNRMSTGTSDSGWNAGGNRMGTGVSDSGWNAGGNRMSTGVSDSGWNTGGNRLATGAGDSGWNSGGNRMGSGLLGSSPQQQQPRSLLDGGVGMRERQSSYNQADNRHGSMGNDYTGGYHTEEDRSSHSRGLLEEPVLQQGRGMEQQDYYGGGGGGGYSDQGYEDTGYDEGGYEDNYQSQYPQSRGLLDTPPSQRNMMDNRQKPQGLMDEPGYHDHPRGRGGVRNEPRNQGNQGAYRENTERRGLMASPPVPPKSILKNPTVRKDEPSRRQGLMDPPDRMGNLLERRDRQLELIEKAEMQMRMIEEEQQQEELRRREMLLMKQQDAILTQQQLMMKAKMQQQQQKLNRKRPNDGLLGSGPMQMGNQQMGNIPSLFDVPMSQTRNLGKRPSSTSPRLRDNKRPRQGPPDNRDRGGNRRDHDKQRSRESNDRSRNPSRGGDSRRNSRSEQQQSASKTRDRKDSDTKKSGKTPDRSSVSSTKGKSDNKSNTKMKEEPKPKEPAKPKDTKGKDGAKGKDEGKAKKEQDIDTKVTVIMGEEYDPANPTGDGGDAKTEPKPAAKTGETMEIDVKPVEVTEEKKEKEEEQKKGEQKKGMDINLTVTINKKGRSVNDTDKAGEEKPREKKYKCNVCAVECYDEESFGRHMNGAKHRKKMAVVMGTGSGILHARQHAEQHLRQIESQRRGSKGKPLPTSTGKALETNCKVCSKKFTGAYKDHKEDPDHKTKDERRKAGCKLCKVELFNTFADLTKHLQGAWHQKMSWPECKLCNQRFKSPRKFVQHCKTKHHIENREKNRSTEDLEMDELVTLDTIGFDDDEKDSSGRKKMVTSTPMKDGEAAEDVPTTYDPNTAVGQQYVVSVVGYFCKLCHKFYTEEKSAKVTHCMTKTHYDKSKRAAQFRAKRMMEKQSTEKKSDEGASRPKTDITIDLTIDDTAADKTTETMDSTADNTADKTGTRLDDTAANDTSKKDDAANTTSEKDDTATNTTAELDDTTANSEADNEADTTADTTVDMTEESQLNGDDTDVNINDKTVDHSQSDKPDEMEGSGDEEEGETKDSTVNVSISLDSDTNITQDIANELDDAVELEDVEMEEKGSVQVTVSPRGQKTAGPPRARRGRSQVARRGKKN